MDCQEIISTLRSMASEKYKANVVKMGIPEKYSIGVSTGDIRNLAKSLGKSNTLAYELWRTEYHEARILAVLLFDKKHFSLEEADSLMGDVISWDLCDHLCKNLILKLNNYEDLISEWVASEQTYKKRGAFTLIASSAIHKKNIPAEAIENYLHLIYDHSQDEQEHVKKAVLWALKEIGKRDFDCNEKAILLAHELTESQNKTQEWIGKNALRELETLVKVAGRGRLISADSQMGKEIQQ